MGTLRKIRKSLPPSQDKPPIVFVPDTSYIDDKGRLKPTGVIIVADEKIYARMKETITNQGAQVDGRTILHTPEEEPSPCAGCISRECNGCVHAENMRGDGH